jgi:hypothetical protein
VVHCGDAIFLPAVAITGSETADALKRSRRALIALWSSLYPGLDGFVVQCKPARFMEVAADL